VPTTFATLTTSDTTTILQETTAPSNDIPVEVNPSPETNVGGHETQPEPQPQPQPTVTVPFQAPIHITTLVTSITTTSVAQVVAPEPTPPAQSQDDGSWHTTYPAGWNGTVLSV
jgi:hypothetical protein